MTPHEKQALYARTVALLKPAMSRIAAEPAFRDRFEASPIEVFDELGVALDDETRRDLEGKSFSEFWATRRRAIEGPVQVRDLPPPSEPGALDDQHLEHVHGGVNYPQLSFAPPYVPVGGFAPPLPALDVNQFKIRG